MKFDAVIVICYHSANSVGMDGFRRINFIINFLLSKDFLRSFRYIYTLGVLITLAWCEGKTEPFQLRLCPFAPQFLLVSFLKLVRYILVILISVITIHICELKRNE